MGFGSAAAGKWPALPYWRFRPRQRSLFGACRNLKCDNREGDHVDGEERGASRWVVRLVKVSVVAIATILVVWYALQFRTPRRPPVKSPNQQLAILRNRGEKALRRRIASDALIEVNAAVVGELTAELSAGDAVGRELAALALGRLGAESDVDTLIAALGDPEAAVHEQAAKSLFELLRRLGERGLHRLADLLTHDEAEIRRRSVIELGRAAIGEPECLDPLRGALRDSDARVRAEAYAALARHSAIPPDELIAALDDADSLVQITACTLLGRMGRAAKPAIGKLAMCYASNGATTESARQALLSIGREEPEIVSILVPLLGSKDQKMVGVAASLLLELGHPTEEVRHWLLARVEDPREGVADRAIEGLRRAGIEGQLRPPELIDALEKTGESVLSLVLHDERILSDRLYVMPFYYPRELQGYGVTDRDLTRLGGLRNLRLLDLSGNPVGDAGLAAIAGMEKLKWLFLYDTKITSAGLARLAGMIQLRSLALGGCEITDEGLEFLEQLPALEALDLRKTKVTDAGMRRLAGLKSLKAIWLEETQVTDDGLAPLAGLPLLEDLGYLDKQFTLRGLAKLKQLVTLRPPPDSVVDDDLALLAGMPRLRELFLAKAPVTDAGLEHIGKLAQLEKLYLYDTKITDAGLPKLRSLVNLKQLHLPSTRTAAIAMGPAPPPPITEQGLEALQQALPKLEWPLVPAKRRFSTMNAPYEVVGLRLEDEADSMPSIP